jgi:hypothetical protein
MADRRDTAAKLNEKLAALERLKEQVRLAAKPVVDDAAIGHISDMTDKYPLLVAMMTCHLVKGGPAEGATILLWGKEEGLGGILNVKPLGVRAFIDSECLVGWLDEAERLLGDKGHRWAKEKKQKRSGGSYGRSKGRS